ncbi:MAG: S8 family serine peptidase [Chloroflexia bacterium]|nr:S8 family serine peptidase [Chloroflexia bacterium]
MELKVAAPGVNIFSTTPNDEYKSLNGTSMATPYVSGLIGLMKSFKPKLTTAEAYNILNSTGIDTKDTRNTGKFIQPYVALSTILR